MFASRHVYDTCLLANMPIAREPLLKIRKMAYKPRRFCLPSKGAQLGDARKSAQLLGISMPNSDDSEDIYGKKTVEFQKGRYVD